MALDKNYTVERIWVNDGTIVSVQFKTEFTDPSKPGASSIHAGVIPIEFASLPENATNQQIAGAIETFFVPQQSQLEQFHQGQIDFEYMLENATPVDKDVPEQELAPLTSRQLRLGLVQNGISLASVEATINAIPDTTTRELAKIEWEYATSFSRTHPLIDQIAGALGLTEEQVNDMWGSSLEL